MGDYIDPTSKVEGPVDRFFKPKKARICGTQRQGLLWRSVTVGLFDVEKKIGNVYRPLIISKQDFWRDGFND